MEAGTHPSENSADTDSDSDAETESESGDRDRQITVGVDGASFPVVDVLTGRGFITGKSGSGKSNSASVVIEELLENGYPCLIVDTDGEYYGLKERYEMLHVGADDQCDLQVGPEHAERLAELALEQNVPIILDVSGFLGADDANDLIRETARHLFAMEKQQKKPFLLVVEEIHEYIPEGGGLNETGKMLIKISKRGRKHGLGIVGISQRPADVKKDFITQANWVVWHRLTWDNDTKVLGRVTDREYADAVSDLADGEAFVQTDWTDTIDRIQFKRKRTFDAGATPGLEEIERPELKSIGNDLADELEEISDREQRRQDRVSKLETRLEEKDERIEELKRERDQARDVSDAAKQFADALADDISDIEGGVPEDFEEQLESKNETIADLRDRVDDLEAQLSEVQEERDELETEAERLRGIEDRVDEAERIEDQLSEIEAWFESAPAALRTAGEQAQHPSDETGDSEQDGSSEEVTELRDRLEAAQSRIEDLEAQTPIDVPDDYESFVDDEYVQEAIDEAKDEGSPKYVRATVAAILRRGGPATRAEIARDIDIQSDTNIEKGIKPLAERGIVTVDGTGPEKTIDFDLENVHEIHEQQSRKDRTEELMEQF